MNSPHIFACAHDAQLALDNFLSLHPGASGYVTEVFGALAGRTGYRIHVSASGISYCL